MLRSQIPLKTKLRWPVIIAAIPVGAVLGYLCLGYAWEGLLHLQGKGHSHNDLVSMVVAGLLGAVVGTFSLPFCIWRFTRPPDR